MARNHKHGNQRQFDAGTIQEFEILRGQVRAFYNEISILSKKSPDGEDE